MPYKWIGNGVDRENMRNNDTPLDRIAIIVLVVVFGVAWLHMMTVVRLLPISIGLAFE